MSESLRRGLRVLAALAEEPATATEVAQMTSVSLSTAVRLLQLLDHEGFARRGEDGRYHVGARLLSTAYQVVAGMDIRKEADPVLRDLNQDTGQTVHFGYFDNPTVIYIDKYEGRAAVRMNSRIGQMAPLHCTATGKAIVAFLPDPERAKLVAGLEFSAYTENTITDPAAYVQELDRIRERGYALNVGEQEAVISAAAVPLMEPGGRVQHAIDLAVPNFLVGENELRALVPKILSAAREIERRLGY